MSIFVPWLADAARLTGYPVVELDGWRTRGHGGMTAVEGVVCHHTAGPATGEAPSLKVVRDGRADLAGPLAHAVLGRSGTVYIVAAGLAWHAGASAWSGFADLNLRFLGIEAEDDGDGTWTTAQLDAYPRLVAALLHYMRRGPDRVCAHRECALPAGRKPDPTGIDMHAFRARVAALLTDPLHLIPRDGTAQEEDELTPEQAAQLNLIYTQLAGHGSTTGEFKGWPTWEGGSREQLTLVDFARRANVQLVGLRAAVDALATAVATGSGISPAELQQAITDGLRDGLVAVDVTVHTQRSEATTP